jgi:hypothetical protein
VIESLRRLAVRSFASTAKPTAAPTRQTTPWTAVAMTAILERNALKEFYHSSKGSKWTVRTNWMNPCIWHCYLPGIWFTDASNNTVKLELPSNRLSGTLTPKIANLGSLKEGFEQPQYQGNEHLSLAKLPLLS